MKVLTRVLVLCLAGIQLVQSQDTIDLGSGTLAVTEGVDSFITVDCDLNGGVALARDAQCILGVMTGSTAENTYDVADVANYICRIPAGALSGSVDIPLIDDFVIDNGESLIVECATPSAGDSAGTPVTFTINDGGNTDGQLTIVPRVTLHKISEEATMLGIVVDTLDPNGDIAPNEDDIMVAFVYPTAATSDTADGTADYDNTAGPFTVAGSLNGVGTSAFTLNLPLTTDTILENLETVNILLSDSTTVASVTVDATTTIAVQITDDDKPELVIVNEYPRLPRRSKKDVVLKAFNNMQAWDSFDLTWMPFNLKDCDTRDITTNDGFTVRKTTLARPKYRSRGRFNEYKYSTTQTINTMTYTLDAYAYVSTTSHTRSRAPIEAWAGPTWTIYPQTVDAGTGDCQTIESTAIVVPRSVFTRDMRWWYIPAGGTSTDQRRLTRYNGRNLVPITECSDDGLYIPIRRRRGKLGWVDFVRVYIAECPEGFTGAPTCTTPVECEHGGEYDPALSLCSCPPGFAGTNCEIATEPGTFGGSCQFRISDIWPGNRYGQCVQFSFPFPLGATCGAGFYGEDCCQPCERGRWFGANCEEECHCVDDHCDPFSGHCSNGCAPFYTGDSCQNGGPP